MNKHLRTLVTVILTGSLFISSYMLLLPALDSQADDAAHNQARRYAAIPIDTLPRPDYVPSFAVINLPQALQQEMHAVPLAELPVDPADWQDAPFSDDPYFEQMNNIELSSLQQINSDIIGWISIPATPIDFPLLQGKDNQQYLNTTWNKRSSVYGSIFLECQNKADLSNFNSIIYGHNMNDDRMFGTLLAYAEDEYRQQHPYIYIKDSSGVHRYEIFAAYEPALTDITYRLEFDHSSKQQLIDFALTSSLIDTGIKPTVGNRLLTLSTCTGNGFDTRWVVQARLISATDLNWK